jgi:hypothetical protein
MQELSSQLTAQAGVPEWGLCPGCCPGSPPWESGLEAGEAG